MVRLALVTAVLGALVASCTHASGAADAADGGGAGEAGEAAVPAVTGCATTLDPYCAQPGTTCPPRDWATASLAACTATATASSVDLQCGPYDAVSHDGDTGGFTNAFEGADFYDAATGQLVAILDATGACVAGPSSFAPDVPCTALAPTCPDAGSTDGGPADGAPSEGGAADAAE